MQISRLKIKFRNDIRKKELDAYKQGVRTSLLQSNSISSQPSMDYEALLDGSASFFSEEDICRLEEIISDFQCNYVDFNNQSDSENFQYYLKQLRELPTNCLNYTLDDLQLVLLVCLKAQFQGNHLFFQESNYLSIIADAFYIIMERNLVTLLKNKDGFQNVLYSRLHYAWTICHQRLLDKFMEDYDGSKEKQLFILKMVQQKAMFVFRLKLLRNRIILERNKYSFSLVFDTSLGNREMVDLDRILIAFILTKNYETTMAVLPAEQALFSQFIEDNICNICNSFEVGKAKGMFQDRQNMQAFVMILQMIIHLSWNNSSSSLLTLSEDALHTGLRVGLEMFEHVQPQLRQCLLINMMKIVEKQKLYCKSDFQGTVTQICSQTIFANIENKLFEILAIEIVAVMRGYTTLMNFQLHYGLCMLNSEEQDKDFYQSCLSLIQYVCQQYSGYEESGY